MATNKDFVVKNGIQTGGAITLPSDPTNALHAATKQYVDALTTSEISEGTNLYFTNSRSRGALSITAGTSGVTYSSSTGVLDFSNLSAPSDPTNLYATGTATRSSAETNVTVGVDTASNPIVSFVNASAAAGAKVSQIQINSSGNWQIGFVNDAINSSTTWLDVARSGNTASNITLTGTAITLTGAVTGTSFSGAGSGLTSLNASNLASGTVGTARLGSGTASSSTFLRGDGTWAAPTVSAVAATGAVSISTTAGVYAGVTSTTPILALSNSSSSANNKLFQLQVDGSGTINGYFSNDANNSSTAWLTVTRSSNTASNITLTGTAITLTGAVSGTSFSGSGTSLTALNASNLSSGTVGTARLGTGTADSTTYLRGDGTWASPSSTFTGGTISGATTYSSTVTYNAGVYEKKAAPTVSSTTTIDASAGNTAVLALTTNITTLSFSNLPASGNVYGVTVFIAQDSTGGRTITWPAAVKWAGGSAPVLTVTGSKTDIVYLTTYDAGTTWYGSVVGMNY